METASMKLKLDESTCMNRGVEVDKDESEEIGLKCTHKLIHPEYVLFLDEVGCNILIKKIM